MGMSFGTLARVGDCPLCNTKFPMIRVYNQIDPMFTRCYIKRCKKKPKYIIVGDDGRPKSSRPHTICCPNHLALAIKKAEEYNVKLRSKHEKKNSKRRKKKGKKR